MSAIFKNTNRFLVLMDPPIDKNDKNVIPKTNEKEKIIQKPENKFNNFKADPETIRQHYSLENKQYNEYRRHQEYETRRFNMENKIRKTKEDEIKTITNKDNFPQLKLINSCQKEFNPLVEANNIYFNKLLNIEDSSIKNDKNKTDTEKEECIPDGCVCIKFDKKENKHIWLYGKNIINNQEKQMDNKDDSENPYIVMSRVTQLHKRRRSEHIRKWGIDEYEKMFMFPNYDYDYYDKLDEYYEPYYNTNQYDNQYHNQYDNQYDDLYYSS
jgi:hypothetical protein